MSNYDLTTNPNTSPETLDILANDGVWMVRRDVAENPNTPPEALDRLANDEEYWIRYRVAQNPSTPQYIKTYLRLKAVLET